MNWSIQIALTLAETISADAPEKIIRLRAAALLSLRGYLHAWEKQGLVECILNRVCEKKIQFIQEADTKGAMTEILPSPAIGGNRTDGQSLCG